MAVDPVTKSIFVMEEMISELSYAPVAFAVKKLNGKLYENAATKLGWAPPQAYRGIVEREIIVYDTFYLLNTFVGHDLSFGGGTLLNWIHFRDTPRFSFDIDSTYLKSPTSKTELLNGLVDRLNHTLRSKGYATGYAMDEKSIEIGAIHLDVEKDYFPNLLSLQRSVPCFETGEEISQYLKRRHLTLSPSDARILRKTWNGRLPRIEQVRIEIAFSDTNQETPVFPFDRKTVSPILSDALDVRSTVAKVTLPETIAALKIAHLAKPYQSNEESFLLVDFIKDLCDLRILDRVDYRKVIEQMKDTLNIDPPTTLGRALIEIDKLSTSAEAANWYENRGIQTLFMRKKMTFDQLASKVRSSLEALQGFYPKQLRHHASIPRDTRHR